MSDTLTKVSVFPGSTLLDKIMGAIEETLDDEDMDFDYFDELLDLALEHGISANEFFRVTKGAAWDRPSAFHVWASHQGWSDPPDLGMNALTDEEMKYLSRLFGEDVPSHLTADDWDT